VDLVVRTWVPPQGVMVLAEDQGESQALESIVTGKGPRGVFVHSHSAWKTGVQSAREGNARFVAAVPVPGR